MKRYHFRIVWRGTKSSDEHLHFMSMEAGSQAAALVMSASKFWLDFRPVEMSITFVKVMVDEECELAKAT